MRLFYRVHNCPKVIVQDDQVRRRFGHVTATQIHGQAYVGRLREQEQHRCDGEFCTHHMVGTSNTRVLKVLKKGDGDLSEKMNVSLQH